MLSLGTLLGGTYRLERVIGRGGQSCVFEVSHVRLPRRFAAKVASLDLDQGTPGTEQFSKRFRQEAEILATLASIHSVEVVDWNVQDGFAYIIQELLQGETLASYLHREGRMEPDLVCSVVSQIAEAVQAAHQRGVLHRDLKPSNLFLVRNGPYPNFIKVLDFGIAKLLRGASPRPTDGSGVIGTPGYMSPEQVRGEELDERSDLFSLAAVAYELLSGRPAFCTPDEPPLLALQRIVHEEPPPLPEGLSAVEATLRVALHKCRELRYPSVTTFADAMTKSLVAPSPPASTGPAMTRQEQPTREGSSQVASTSRESIPAAEVPASRLAPDRRIVPWSRYVLLGLVIGLVSSRWFPQKPGPSTGPAAPQLSAFASSAVVHTAPPPLTTASNPDALTPFRRAAGTDMGSSSDQVSSSVAASHRALQAAMPAPRPPEPVVPEHLPGPAPDSQAPPARRRSRVFPYIAGVSDAQRRELIPCMRDLQSLNPGRKLVGTCLTLSGHSRLRLNPDSRRPLPFPPEHLRILDECLANAGQAVKMPTTVTACFDEVTP